MLSYIQLKSFVVLCNTGSFSLTASQMDTNQPTISKRIKQIEEDLDKVLLNRKTNGKEVSLTQEGKIFLSYCDEIVKSYESLNSLFINERKTERLSIGALPSIFNLGLNKRTKKLLQIYPSLDLNIEIHGSDVLLSMLKNKQVDVAFLLGDCSDTDIETKFIMYLDFGWYVTFNLYNEILRHKDVSSIFANYRILLSKGHSTPKLVVERVLSNNNIIDYDMHSSDNLQTMVSLISQGFGIGFLPKRLVEWDNKRSSEKLYELNLFPTEGVNVYSAIMKDSDQKEYYNYLTDVADTDYFSPD